MKRKWYLLGMLLLTFSLLFIGCDPEADNGNGEYTVTFDLDGGKIGENTANVTRTVTSGETVSDVPIATKENYTFGGWYTQKNGVGNVFNSSTAVTANITVYANWNSIGNINPFIGTWSGTVTTEGPDYGKFVTLNFLEDLTWNFAIFESYQLRGTYTYENNSGILNFSERSNDGMHWTNDFTGFPVTYNTATIVGNTMTIVAPGLEGSTIVTKSNSIVGFWEWINQIDVNRYIKIKFNVNGTGILVTVEKPDESTYTEVQMNITLYEIIGEKIFITIEGSADVVPLDFELSLDGNSLSITGLVGDQTGPLLTVFLRKNSL